MSLLLQRVRAALAAQSATDPPRDGNRAHLRHPAERVCLVYESGPEGTPQGGARAAALLDVSAGGVGLVLPRAFALGTTLIVRPLRGQPAGLVVRVVRTEERPDGWLHGCELEQILGEDDLQKWLGTTTAAPEQP